MIRITVFRVTSIYDLVFELMNVFDMQLNKLNIKVPETLGCLLKFGNVIGWSVLLCSSLLDIVSVFLLILDSTGGLLNMEQ